MRSSTFSADFVRDSKIGRASPVNEEQEEAPRKGTMKAAVQNYQARMRRVLDYIEHHLDGNLDLETVSRIAACSKFHFHRQFTATFELSVHRYVQLVRLKRASH